MNENEYYEMPFITGVSLFFVGIDDLNNPIFVSIEPRVVERFRDFLKDVAKRYNTDSFTKILELEILAFPEIWNTLFNVEEKANVNKLVRVLDSGSLLC
ncbi:MAG: hypothetical protein IPO06_28750 [Leptospiraceae bacterium]|nr:hypothetical protein [Leptospiraceae bacterium]MBK9503296.1 hypothetical protein [Leptospiraceae bacterium]